MKLPRPYKNFELRQIERNLDCLVRNMGKHGDTNARSLMPAYLAQQEEYVARTHNFWRIDTYLSCLMKWGTE